MYRRGLKIVECNEKFIQITTKIFVIIPVMRTGNLTFYTIQPQLQSPAYLRYDHGKSNSLKVTWSIKTCHFCHLRIFWMTILQRWKGIGENLFSLFDSHRNALSNDVSNSVLWNLDLLLHLDPSHNEFYIRGKISQNNTRTENVPYFVFKKMLIVSSYMKFLNNMQIFYIRRRKKINRTIDRCQLSRK